MGRHKRRIHKNIGKYQDRPRNRKVRMTKFRELRNQHPKTMQRSRGRKTTYLIGKI